MIGFDFIWLLFDPVCYFWLATESDDSVAKSVGSIFQDFVSQIYF